MDGAAQKAAERVAQFYFHSDPEFVLLGETDDVTWGRIAVALDGADREWFLSLHDAVRDLARTLWPAGTRVDVATGRISPSWGEEAEQTTAALSHFWTGGRWDEVEHRISDDGSAREWFQALADAVRELHRALEPTK